MAQSENAIVGIYRRPSEAEQAFRRLQLAGFDMKKVSVAGKESHNGSSAVGFYESGGGIRYWGRLEKFWGSLWGTLKGWAYFSVPGLGPVLVAGPLASWIVSALDNTAIFGGLSVVGAGLHSIGISRDKILACEGALRDGGYLVLACGAADEVCTAKEVLESTIGMGTRGGMS